MAEQGDRAGAGTVVETHRPLSQSSLWAVQHAYYTRSGVQAWASGDVPHFLTSGPMLARAYAAIVEGFVADCLAGRLGPIDPEEPIYVLELGAGTGRLAAHFARALEPRAIEPLRLVYVLSDLVEANLEFWRGHEKLAPLLASGRCDLARFDAMRDAVLELERSGRSISAGELANPLIVVANYLFDVLPQDFYRAQGDERLEEHVALVGAQRGPALDDPGFFREVWLAARPVPCPPDRYGDPELDALLDGAFAERAGAPAQRFLFPAPALRGLRNLAGLSGGRMLAVVGERPGGLPERDLAEDPGVALRPGALLGMGVHGGSCSLPVDLEILGHFARRRGGDLLLPGAAPAGLVVSALLLGERAEGPGARATRHRFLQAVEEVGPEDLFLTLQAALEHRDELPLAMLLALIRVGGYDPYILGKLHGALQVKLPAAHEAGVEEAVRVLEEVWERDYPIERETDLAFGIAALLALACRYEDALRFFARSRAAHGPRARTEYNAALCHLHLEDVGAALAALAEARSLEPEFAPARELMEQIEDELAKR